MPSWTRGARSGHATPGSREELGEASPDEDFLNLSRGVFPERVKIIAQSAREEGRILCNDCDFLADVGEVESRDVDPVNLDRSTLELYDAGKRQRDR